MTDFVAAKKMEDFARTILSATQSVQENMWKNLESILTAEEINGLKVYVGLFHMFDDQRYYDAVNKAVGEQLYNELHK